MKTLTVSSRGQIVIPKEIMASLDIKQGDKLFIDMMDGKLVLEPVVNIPRSQAWFWDRGIQTEINRSRVDFENGNFQRYDLEDFLRELND